MSFNFLMPFMDLPCFYNSKVFKILLQGGRYREVSLALPGFCVPIFPRALVAVHDRPDEKGEKF